MAHDPAENEAKFWTALRRDMTVMLGLARQADARPMTALIDGAGDHGPIWFFSSTEAGIAAEAQGGEQATFTFVSKGHDVWANVTGSLRIDMDRAAIDRLWNPHVAAWYEEGRDDPKLRLLRFDPAEAKIWLDGSSLVAGVLALFGRDPKASYDDNAAEVSLR